MPFWSCRNGHQVPATWWGKCALAGVLGGVAMGLYLMIASMALGTGFWSPMNAIGATFPAFRPVSPDFEPGPGITGVALYLITSSLLGLVYGAIGGLVWPRQARDLGMATMMGVLYGAAVWIVMGLMVGPLIDPMLRSMEQVNYAVGHLIYGVVTALLACLWARDTELRVLSVSFAPEVPVYERGQRERVDR